jgi:Sec-independent protein translocase protein TatA
MLQSWVDEGLEGTRETVQDTARLALHVLSSAGFGISRPFNAGVQKLPLEHHMPYQDALSLILRNVVTLAIIPKDFLTVSILPKKLRKLGQAAKEFKQYMEEMLETERTSITKRKSGNNNLLSALIQASDEAKETNGGRKSNLGLTDDEIYGNIFIYNLAGHETTANTLAAAIVLLAANPECQEWLAEELKNAPIEQSYESVFPNLNRCLAIMVNHPNPQQQQRPHTLLVRNPPSLWLHRLHPQNNRTSRANPRHRLNPAPPSPKHSNQHKHPSHPLQSPLLGPRLFNLEAQPLDHTQRRAHGASTRPIHPLGRRPAYLSRAEVRAGGIRRRCGDVISRA